MEPDDTKKIIDEINILKKEKIEKENNLNKIQTLLNKTEAQLNSLTNDEIQFNMGDIKDNSNSN